MIFAGHQSFQLREGWLRKGLLCISRDPDFFSTAYPEDELGVGHNMVDAIRYWLQATGLARALREKGQKQNHYAVTPFGERVLRYDPYFEDEGTLWFLHVHLATNFDYATTWAWFFNSLGARHFTQDFFLSHLQAFVDSKAKRKIAAGSLERDFRCFVRTYSRSLENVHTNPEESFDCPLASLNLLEQLPKTRSFRLANTAEIAVPDLVVGYCLSLMVKRNLTPSVEVTFRDALYGENSPGRLLSLDPDGLYAKLTKLSASSRGLVSFTQTAGLNVVTVADVEPDSVIERYYRSVETEQ